MDFTLQNDGSICILRPHTPRAVVWVERNIGEDNGFQPYYPAVVIEPRYLEDIVIGIHAAGLSIMEEEV